MGDTLYASDIIEYVITRISGVSVRYCYIGLTASPTTSSPITPNFGEILTSTNVANIVVNT